MKYILCFCVLVTSLFDISAQALNEFNNERNKMSKQGMIVLGSWSVANMISSPILSSQSSGSNKYFYQMNGYWNIVNLALATSGYFSAKKADKNELTYQESILAQRKHEKILLFNAGLDLAYMAAGAYLIERSKNIIEFSDQSKGFGQSLILQGGFLFLFDAVSVHLHSKHGTDFIKSIDGLSFRPTFNGAVLRYNL